MLCRVRKTRTSSRFQAGVLGQGSFDEGPNRNGNVCCVTICPHPGSRVDSKRSPSASTARSPMLLFLCARVRGDATWPRAEPAHFLFAKGLVIVTHVRIESRFDTLAEGLRNPDVALAALAEGDVFREHDPELLQLR